MFLVHRFLSPWWCRHYIPLKRRFLQEPHGVISQKMAFFIVTAVKTNLTVAHQLSCSKPHQSRPSHPISKLHLYIIDPPAYLVILVVSFFLAFLFSFILHPAHLVFDLTILIMLGDEYTLWRSSLCSPLYLAISSPLGPNILVIMLFRNTLSLFCSLNFRDKVLHPYRITEKIMLSYILIFMHTYVRWNDGRFWTEWSQALPRVYSPVNFL
jgi:hypothetical protein